MSEINQIKVLESLAKFRLADILLGHLIINPSADHLVDELVTKLEREGDWAAVQLVLDVRKKLHLISDYSPR